MAKYRKKPVVIDAMQFDGDNSMDIFAWADSFGPDDSVMRHTSGGPLIIETLEGEMRADPGDWIIRGVAGEYYPCKPDIFEATYEEANDD